MTIRRRWSVLAPWLVALSLTSSCGDAREATRERDRDPEPPPSGSPSPAATAEPSAEASRTIPVAGMRPLGECEGPPGRTLRVLLVGNSQIYFWDLPKILSELSETAPIECPRIAAEGFTRGGQSLHRLWRDGDSRGRDLAATIRDGRYDVVVIAESIGLVELPPPYEDFVKHAGLIIDAARASGARPVLYATPYPDQAGHAFFFEMAAPQLALGRQRGVAVAAGGLAWLRVWSELPNIDLHHPDNEHPGYNGSIVSAMVIHAVLTRGTPLALTPPEGGTCEDRPGQPAPCPVVTSAEVDVFRRAAWAEALATGLR